MLDPSQPADAEESPGTVEESKSEEEKEEEKKSEEDDNYMELYVQKEIKDKVEPLEENLRDREKQIEKLATRLKNLDEQLRNCDKKHTGISNAILSKQGIILSDLTELNILREYARIHEKEQ